MLKRGDFLEAGHIYKLLRANPRRGISYSGSLHRGIKHMVLITVLRKTAEETVNNPYNDRIKGDLLFYTGEGLVGNQEMKRGNLALKNQSKNKYPILVFEKKKPGRYMFLGRYRVLGVTTEMQRDINGQKRKVFLFKLRRVSSTYAS